MAEHLTRSDCRVLRSAVYPMQWMELVMICCGMAVKRMGLLELNVRKMKAQTVKRERATLVGKGRENVTFSEYYVYEVNSKIFLLRRCLEGHLTFG